MTSIAWNAPGENEFQSGLDRGVLYLPDAPAVPWNGLTSVEDNADEVKVESFFYDGLKYAVRRSPGGYNGSIKALTYPTEFERFDGLVTTPSGLTLTHQPVRDYFGLSYRTKVGNDLDLEAGYIIHLLYNLTASPESTSYETQSNVVSPVPFGWKITGIPVGLPGHRPTVHFMLDTRNLSTEAIFAVEEVLYGTSTTDAGLPEIAEIAALLEAPPEFELTIVDNGDGTWTATSDAPGVIVDFGSYFEINYPSAASIDDDTFEVTSS